MTRKECQIHTVGRMAEPNSALENLLQLRHRVRRVARRRLTYLHNSWAQLVAPTNSRPAALVTPVPFVLNPGDQVRVKSREEISATLDHWNRLKGCTFTDEMWKYCGTEQRVAKRVSRFLDERHYQIRKCNGIVLLEGVICEGTADFGPCDRSCLFFWREEWLTKSGRP